MLSTGDELVAQGEPLSAGKVRDANRPMLLALLQKEGCPAVDLGIVSDDEEAIEASIAEAVSGCDALVTSGGVSVGDHDYVRVVLDRMGNMRWWQVAIKPAKPLAFGTVHGVPVLGLPGNPVSSFVSFQLFARPALRRMAGNPCPVPPSVRAVADEALDRRPDGKTHFVRVVAAPDPDGRLKVRSAGPQGSHQLRATAAANALAVLADGEGAFEGDAVEVLMLP